MSQSEENLKAAFAGESQANRRYLAFAQKAEEEGHPQIARLFRAVAAAETVHAFNDLKVLGEVKGTEEDLRAAIHGEYYESTKMYPEFVKQAEAEGNAAARESFAYASRVEKVHHQLFENTLAKLRAGAQFAEFDYYVCQYCGNTVTNSAPKACPICGKPQDWFKKVE
jgi:rubrerythrin